VKIGRGVLILAGALLAAAPLASSGSALASTAVRPAVTTSGVNFVDRAGRTIVLRGVDMSYHSALLARVTELHANCVRLRVLWAAVEPGRMRFDAAELRRLDRFVGHLAAHRVNVELDLRGKREPDWVDTGAFFRRRRAPQSQAAYLGFVRTVVRRYEGNPRVIGFGIFNEPEPYTWNGVGAPRLDRRILRWQAGIRDAILAEDPYTAVFFNVRGGNYGVGTCFRCVGFKVAHTVLDWHDFYNGCCGSGLDATDDNWLPSWPATHNQRNTEYAGTRRNQWLNLAIPWRATHLLGIPMIVGEWGVRNDDVRNMAYNEQLETIMSRHGISWARWDLDCGPKFGLVSHGRLNDQGEWLASEILGPG